MICSWFYKKLVEMESEIVNTQDPTGPPTPCSEKVNVRSLMHDLNQRWPIDI